MLSRKAHDLTEEAYRRHPSRRGEPDWAEKQRILLADLALHVVQTALGDSDLPAAQLQRNLYALLTVADQFIPGHDLKAVAGQLVPE